jgi:hypothetical protein
LANVQLLETDARAHACGTRTDRAAVLLQRNTGAA